MNFSDIQPSWWAKLFYLAAIWGISSIRSLYVLAEQRFSQLCELDWIHIRGLQMGFYWSSSPLYLFSSRSSHSSSLFYFRTNESSEQHLKPIRLSVLIPDLLLLCFCSYLSTHAHSLTCTWIRDCQSEFTPCKRDCRVEGVWSVLMWLIL